MWFLKESKMKAFIDGFKELLFRSKLFLFGVRFYEVTSPSDDPVVFEQSYDIQSLCTINFKFQRVSCSDYLLKRGDIVTQHYASYVVTAFFDDDARGLSVEFELDLNGKSFFFNGVFNGFGLEESKVLSLIADVYLDFLKSKSEPVEKPA